MDDPTSMIAARLRMEREARGWSLADLAARSAVSKAMISKIERGEASPTATLLGRLSGAFGLSLSALLVRAEAQGGRISRLADQALWRDPDTGYLRRQILHGRGMPTDLVAVELPAGARVPFPAAAYAFLKQAIWVLEGRLTFLEGSLTHRLEAGDCLELGAPVDCAFLNEQTRLCRYLVVVLREAGGG